MSDWKPIETIPTEMKDGREVYVRRVYEGRIVTEGYAVFGVCASDAPQRQSLGLDPLGRLSAADYALEGCVRASWADTAKWLKPDRMYSFPAPTHWRPNNHGQ